MKALMEALCLWMAKNLCWYCGTGNCRQAPSKDNSCVCCRNNHDTSQV